MMIMMMIMMMKMMMLYDDEDYDNIYPRNSKGFHFNLLQFCEHCIRLHFQSYEHGKTSLSGGMGVNRNFNAF